MSKNKSRCLLSTFLFHATAIPHPVCANSSVMSFIPLDKNSYACLLIEFTKQQSYFLVLLLI
ncbi:MULTISPECIES: hypothetical protein [unclassified Gilliamella]|uniref:hypothetical protein n=1 Tax=unclassified Gilliamella TaxID=2685620 RepID=UPI00117B929E|nr:MULTISPECIES: hypothetical protein [unclassified Gilliamella]